MVVYKNDGLYMFRWTARNGKRHTIYDATLEGLRDKEDKIKHDLADGIRAVESNVTVNDMFTLWRKDKIGIKEHTLTNYVYMYNRFIKDTIGEMKIKDVRKSDIRHFYGDILRNNKMQLTLLIPSTMFSIKSLPLRLTMSTFGVIPRTACMRL